jgi:hypothetical protein
MFDRVLVDQVEAAVADLDVCTDGELSDAVVACEHLRSQLFAAEAKVVARWDARQVWAADGALSGGQWLAHRGESSRNECGARVRRARRLAEMPLTSAALESGEIGAAKACLLAEARKPAVADGFAEAEAELVAHARTFAVDGVARIVRRWTEVTRPDARPGDDVLGRSASHWSLSETLNGMFVSNGTFDGEWGSILRRGVDAEVLELLRSGVDAEGPTPEPGHLRAQALIELVTRGMAGQPGSVPARPSITALVDAEVLSRPPLAPDQFDDVCRLDGGIDVPGETARRMACGADITRLIIGADGSVLDVLPDGPSLDALPNRRAPTPSQRHALIARDQHCTFPGCDRLADWTEAHHLRFYRHNGKTVMLNLCLLCRRHHHLIHEGGYGVERDPNTAVLRFTRPDGSEIDHGPPTTPPLRPRPGPRVRASPMGRPPPDRRRPRPQPVR